MERIKQAKLFFDGKLNKNEARSFLIWYLSADSEEEIYTEINKLWLTGKKYNEDYKWAGKHLFEKIQNMKENEFDLHTGKTVYSPSQAPKRSNYLNIAAVIALLILGSISMFLLNDRQLIEIEKPETLVVKSNPRGQKSKVHLPDGTIVYLNAESQLSFVQEEFAKVRNLKLIGEAFFEVAEDSLRPFTVVTERLSTTALGTSFNIRAFENMGKIDVTLVTGKVLVSDNLTKRTLILSPGEGVQVQGDQEVFAKENVEVIAKVQWKDGILVFDNAKLNEVITALKRWYGVEIEVYGTPEIVKCSGTFHDEYLNNVLEVLGHSLGFTYAIEDKKVKMFFKP